MDRLDLQAESSAAESAQTHIGIKSEDYSIKRKAVKSTPISGKNTTNIICQEDLISFCRKIIEVDKRKREQKE